MENGISIEYIGIEHDGFPLTSVISGLGTVIFDGKPTAKAGDLVSCGGVLQGGNSVNIS